MADQQPPRPGAVPQTRAKWTALGAACGISMAAVCGPLVKGWEDGPKGPALVPYRDIVGVWTQCSGETLHVTAATPAETPAGCAVKLDKRLAGFAQAVVACSPKLRGYDPQWAAVTSLAYNIGTAAYCKSTVDRRFDAGEWRAACDAFLLWNKAGGRVVAGLANRRAAERELCLKGL